jgi:penicillin-binding protein 1C
VDGVLARRQPGSALKPFVYALALERGRTLAQTVRDEPLILQARGGAYRPVDYDGRFRGAVTLREALASSLNLPALRLAAELTPRAVLERLRAVGFKLPLAANHYGVGLALGAGEVSLLELTRAYAALARGGVFGDLRLWQGQKPSPTRRVFTPAAARLAADVLADDRARAMGFGRHGLLELPFPAAVKTGTSQRHRDNWCVGFTSEYTVGVWAGNFAGRPMNGVSGVSGAAPLWRQAMLLLHRGRPGRLPPWPPGMERRVVCLASGLAAGPNCPETREEVFAPGTAPRRICDRRSPAARRKVAAGVTLVTPAPGAVYALDPDVPARLQILGCRAQARGAVRGAQWRLDGRALAHLAGDPLAARIPLAPGRRRVEVTVWGPGGRARAEAVFTVLDSAAGS